MPADHRTDGRGAVGVFGVPLAKWLHTRGYNEHFIYWGHMEIEFVRRVWNMCGGGMINLAELHKALIGEVSRFEGHRARGQKRPRA